MSGHDRAVPHEDPQHDLIEQRAEANHIGWMEGKAAIDITTRKAEDGEELMVPWADLTEKAKDLDRYPVRAVLAALTRLGYTITKTPG
jgi:hypothetical protein